MGRASPPEKNISQPKSDRSSPDNANDAECERVLELIPAFSIGATDPEEHEFVKAKLAECPEATLELAKYMKLAEALHYSATHVQARSALADSLHASIQPPPTTPKRGSLPLPQTIRPIAGGPTHPITARYWRPFLALSVVIVCLLLISNVYWLIQVERINSREDQVDARLHDADTALMLFGLGATNRIELPPLQAGIQPAPFAAIVWDSRSQYALLYVKNFPDLPPDKAYQLWLGRDGQQTSGGLFFVDDDGIGILLFRTTVPVPSFEAIEITTEPAEGSSKPTTPAIVRRNS